MKTSVLLIAAFQLFSFSAFAQSPTPKPITGTTSYTVDVTELNLVRITIPDLENTFINAGPVADAIKRYPAIAPLIKSALDSSVADAPDELTANRRATAIAAAGAPLTKTVTDKHTARIAAFAKKKEAALMKVKDTDPERAKAKLDEFIAAGIPIDSKVQTAVNKAVPPPPPPVASPSPAPNDGL